MNVNDTLGLIFRIVAALSLPAVLCGIVVLLVASTRSRGVR